MCENENNERRKSLPYSYHTFLFAFHYKGEIKAGNHWSEESLRSGNDRDDLKLNYQNYRYFTPEARNLLFNDDNNSRYIYDISGTVDRSYIITKGDDRYRLIVDNIKAIVFKKNNIAILQLELENHCHKNLEAVKKINEYGRRINLPYISPENVPHALVADSISLFGKTVNLSDFGDEALNCYEKTDENFINIIPPISDLIKELLPNYEKISPVIDDRMFVCCLIRDDNLSNKMKSTATDIGNAREAIYCDSNLSSELYALAYVDADDATCQSPDMREKILRRSVYDRWRDWGTVDVITHHSFFRITGESPGITASVINPFLSQYITMAVGALIQRATILSISNECAEISGEYFDNDIPNCDEELNERIKKLKSNYVYAQNNIFLDQLTVQEQGIDEFEILKNELYISSSLENLDNKINSIYDFTSEYAENEENSLLNILTRIGLTLTLIQCLAVILSFTCFTHCAFWAQPVVFVLIIGISVICSVSYFFVIRHKKEKEKISKENCNNPVKK